MREVNPWRALVRNALAAERVNTRPRTRTARTRLTYEPPVVPAWAREEYDQEFAERVGVRAFNGQPEDCGEKMHAPGCCARNDVLLEMGCLEFWAYVSGHEYEGLPMRVAA
jgi:3-deoxy-D-arabino-heptulosonate 7-phosphate (DAHP) synthase class II